jgi:hypothetical protein
MGEINFEKFFIADFVCYEKIILEIKASQFIHKDNEAQTINYLKASGLPLGLLINFGKTSLQWKRFIHINPCILRLFQILMTQNNIRLISFNNSENSVH